MLLYVGAMLVMVPGRGQISTGRILRKDAGS